ncbi:MAG TPA: hypothetical protein VFX98_07900 [Longimicrobiaceae bacterium]|nr:hypothetical protein [Longimicrobiaceae bacterium]
MRSYNLFVVDNFPEAERFTTNPQMETTQTPLTTEFFRTGNMGEFVTYSVSHMTKVRLRGQAYSMQNPIDDVSERVEFDGFLHSDRHLLLLCFAKRECREATKRLKKLETATVAVPYRVNLKDLATEFRTIHSSHFRDVQEPFVSSTAIFGSGVHQSEWYQRLQSISTQSAIATDVVRNDGAQRVMITSEGGVVFFRPTSTMNELGIILQLRPMLETHRVQDASTAEDEGGISPAVTDLLSFLE